MSIRKQCTARLSGLMGARTDYEADWKEIATFAQPTRSRFLSNDTGKNRRQRNTKMKDPHGIVAFRTLANGMTSGLSSSSRPWKILGLEDDVIDQDAREWLSACDKEMDRFLASTNFYGAVKAGYLELGLFGTNACVMVEHPDVGAVCHALTAGEYWIGQSDAMVADTLYRRAPMSVRQAVQSFGKAVSTRVMTMYDRSQYDEMVNCYHAIEPNPDFDDDDITSKAYRSIYWDKDDKPDALLRESGYEEQPFWAPRWDIVGNDTYGYGSGVEALSSLRELQLQVMRKNEAIDFMIKPEKIVPANVKLTGRPGNVVTATTVDRDGVVVPYEIPYQVIAAISDEVEKTKRQIDVATFADLFMAITNMQGIQPRNMEEIASRNEEKLTQLGPTIERVNNEQLKVVIDRAFGIMQRGGMLPPVPESMAGREIKVEFVSVLSQMQRMVGIGQIERTASFVGNLAGLFPEATDKLNTDAMIDDYASRAGTPAKMIRSDDDVAKIRADRAQAAQQAKAMEAAPAIQQGADAARLLSETDVGGTSLLQQLTA